FSPPALSAGIEARIGSLNTQAPLSQLQSVREASMSNNISSGNLQISQVLYDFIEKEACPGTGIAPKDFWAALARILDQMAPRNRELLAKRDQLQASIDAWHREHDMQYYLTHKEEYK